MQTSGLKGSSCAGYTEEALEIWVQQGKWDHAFQAAAHLGPDIESDLCLRPALTAACLANIACAHGAELGQDISAAGCLGWGCI